MVGGKHNKRLGRWGEQVAADFLLRQGFGVLERNYHTTRGEIDIVARKRGDYYFIEVKTREAGALAYDVAITASKQQRLRHAVKHYCYHRRIENTGIILASIMVTIARGENRIRCRLAVIY